MKLGDLVIDPFDVEAGVLIVGIIVETDLFAIDDINVISELGSLAELVDALDLGSSALGRPGSTPGGPTVGELNDT